MFSTVFSVLLLLLLLLLLGMWLKCMNLHCHYVSIVLMFQEWFLCTVFSCLRHISVFYVVGCNCSFSSYACAGH